MWHILTSKIDSTRNFDRRDSLHIPVIEGLAYIVRVAFWFLYQVFPYERRKKFGKSWMSEIQNHYTTRFLARFEREKALWLNGFN